MLEHLKHTDPEIYQAMTGEIGRQNHTLEMIASENFTSLAVLEAMGSVMTNKYAEGYPGRRYYGGCTFVDIGEDLARERAQKLFKCGWANVQPHSGTQANMAVYLTLAKPGDTIMGMNLSHGGHLSHGSPVNFSGQLYKVVSYGVKKETGTIDYDRMAETARAEKPKIIIAGASAYPRFWDFAKMREIADEVNAYLVADIAHVAGLVATEYHPSPIPYAHVVTTTTHKTLRGPRGGMIMTDQKGGEIYLPGFDEPKKLRAALNSMVFPGIQGGPLMHVIAAKAVALKEALEPAFKEYCGQIIKNTKAFAERMLEHGFNLVSGGTDNHLVLVDLHNKGVTGKQAEEALENAGITVNKNMVPFDDQPPMISSGIRVGTPALTTKGMKEEQMRQIADMFNRIISDIDNTELQANIKEEIRELNEAFPLYPEE
ncbi:serine hydroxymethyltransferase [bacterium]|nr:serine hydroxymethyltransferase [bacterium]